MIHWQHLCSPRFISAEFDIGMLDGLKELISLLIAKRVENLLKF